MSKSLLDERTRAFASYRNVFYVSNGGNGYFVVDATNKDGVPEKGAVPDLRQFWRLCEQIEAVEDTYERTNHPTYRTMILELLNGLNNVVSKTTDFASWNKYNDDIMWAVIALGRGYEITGNPAFLDQARRQFNVVWSRAWDSHLGGGLWWTTDKQSKNACVNGPAAIAAMILARNTENTTYRSQAEAAFNWLRNTLFDSTTGRVADHIQRDGNKDYSAFTYNQGTFAGAATLLFQNTKNTTYLTQASSAVNWARNNLTGQHVPGILNDECDSEGRTGDPVGFKGIFARWAAKYANAANDATIKNWLTINANAAWSYRNSFGVTWSQWSTRTPDNYITSWECSSALAIMQCAP